jgi:SH3-like domain-containing protein
VTLKTHKAYVRTGPGKIYPVVWVLCVAGWPLKVTDTFDLWCRIEDPLGSAGWIHKSLLSKQKGVYALKNMPIVAHPKQTQDTVARAEKGALLRVLRTEKAWFYVQAGKIRGYVPRHACWNGQDIAYRA